MATGGYGRGLMAPESDIDLLFILPYKQTAWGEQVAEAILYCLWDMAASDSPVAPSAARRILASSAAANFGSVCL